MPEAVSAEKTPSVTDQIKNFIRAIQFRDVEAVEEALKAKVSPETQISSRFHPLFYLLATNYKGDSPDVQQSVTREAYEANTTAIIELLFRHGAKVTEPEKYETRKYKTLMDQLLLTDNVVDGSTVLLYAIVESAKAGGKLYEPDVKATATNLIEGTLAQSDELDPAGGVSKAINALERLHNLARQRMENPQTELEKEAAAAVARSPNNPYAKPFARPGVQGVIKEIFPDGIPDDPEQREAVLKRAFQRKAGNAPSKYLQRIEPKDPAAIIASLRGDIIGLESLKDESENLIYAGKLRQAFAAQGQPVKAQPKLGEIIMGPEGMGKTEYARRKAQLLVSLGLAGPNYVEFTRENSAAPSENMPPQALAGLFAKADIIHIELTNIEFNARNPMADFGTRMISGLKASLEDRKDNPPVVFITGTPELLKDVLDSNPTLLEVAQKPRRLPEMSVDQLGRAFDLLAGGDANKGPGKGYIVEDDARKLIIDAIDDIKRKDLGKDFENVRGLQRVIDAFEGVMGKRLFAPGAEAGGNPSLEDLRTVKAEDVKKLDLFQLLAGPEVARKEPIGFHSRQRFTAQ